MLALPEFDKLSLDSKIQRAIFRDWLTEWHELPYKGRIYEKIFRLPHRCFYARSAAADLGSGSRAQTRREAHVRHRTGHQHDESFCPAKFHQQICARAVLRGAHRRGYEGRSDSGFGGVVEYFERRSHLQLQNPPRG